MKLTTESTSKYFKEAEAKETLLKHYEANAPIESRKHNYTTGAIYTGTWKGGMRHGKGLMIWPDGARYDGNWSFNWACGQGKFIHTDGDTYEGEWANNKANGQGTYQNVKGARYVGKWKDDL